MTDDLGEAGRGGENDAGVAFEGAEGGSALSGLVDVARDDGLAVGSLVALGFLSLAGVAGGTEAERGAIGVELPEGFGGGQESGIVEGLLDGSFRVEQGAGQRDANLEDDGILVAFDQGRRHREILSWTRGTIPDRIGQELVDIKSRSYSRGLCWPTTGPPLKRTGASGAWSVRLGSFVPFLAEQWKPVVAVDPRRLKQLVADLDNKEFSVRENATEELDRLGEFASSGSATPWKRSPAWRCGNESNSCCGHPAKWTPRRSYERCVGSPYWDASAAPGGQRGPGELGQRGADARLTQEAGAFRCNDWRTVLPSP